MTTSLKNGSVSVVVEALRAEPHQQIAGDGRDQDLEQQTETIPQSLRSSAS